MTAAEVTSALRAAFATRVLDDNPTHCFRRSAKEVAAAVPVLLLTSIAVQSQPDFMHQCCRLQGLTWCFMHQLLRGQLAQFVIDEVQQFLSGNWIALLDCRQNTGDFVHWSTRHR